jgi:NitT/TauT family transport system substrate-binding protein
MWKRVHVLAALVALLALFMVSCAQVPTQVTTSGSQESGAGQEAEAPAAPEVEQPAPEEPAAASQQDLRTVRWAIAVKAISPIVINTVVGEHLGFMAEEGLKLNSMTLGANPAVMAALDKGDADMGVGVPSFQLPLAAKGEEVPNLDFYEYTYPFKWDWAVTPDSPITELAQLKGKKVGVPNLGTTAFPMGQLMLEHAGLDPENDVEWIAVGEGAAAGVALERGDIDALVYWDTGFGTIEANGIELRYLPRPETTPNVGGLYISATREFLDENPEVAIGMGRAVAKSTVFCLENPQGCAYAFIQMFPEAAPKGVPLQEQIDTIVGVFKNRSKIWTPYDPSVDQLGYILKSEWEDEVEFAGLQDEIADVEQFYTNEFIDAINNFDAEAVRQKARDFKIPSE